MKYISTKEACDKLGVHPNTLRSWDRKGLIKTMRTPGGIRMYDISSVEMGIVQRPDEGTSEDEIILQAIEILQRRLLQSWTKKN